MKCSIITINYNNIFGLQKTIQSVICQTWRDFEWIIIDGGSTDGSKDLINDVAKHPESNISYWCSEKDKGIYNAMNKGILHARGEYLQFLNSGDMYVNNYSLQNVCEELYKDDVIYGDCSWEHNNDIVLTPNNLSLSFFVCSTIMHPSSFIKRTLFFNALYDEKHKIVSDWSKFLELFLDNTSFRHIEQIITTLDAGGISATNNVLRDNERNEVLINIFGEKSLPLLSEINNLCYQINHINCPEILTTLSLTHNHPRCEKVLIFLLKFYNSIVKHIVHISNSSLQ